MIAITLLALGFLLISWSALLYEEEERRIADAISAWWVRVDDARDAAVGQHAAFAYAVAATVDQWLTQIFGPRLLSIRAVMSSLCLSLASIFLIHLSAFDTQDRSSSAREAAAGFAVGAVSCFIVAVSNRNVTRYLRGVVAIFWLTTFLFFLTKRTPIRAPFVVLGIVLGIVCDFATIILVRLLTRRAIVARSPLAASIVATLSCAVGAAFVVAPVYSLYLPQRLHLLTDVFMFALLSNIFAAIIACSFLIVGTSLLLHRLIWPALERPLYAMQRFGLLAQRRVLFFAGAALVAVGAPSLEGLLERVIKILVP